MDIFKNRTKLEKKIQMKKNQGNKEKPRTSEVGKVATVEKMKNA